MELLTVTGFKSKLGTIYILDNKVKSYIPITQTQPHRNLKSTPINSFKYKIKWLNDLSKESLHWYNQILIALSKNLYKTYFRSKNIISDDFYKKVDKDTKGLPIVIKKESNYTFSVVILRT